MVAVLWIFLIAERCMASHVHGFHPLEFKEFYAHIAHERKKIAEEAYDLPIDPIHELI